MSSFPFFGLIVKICSDIFYELMNCFVGKRSLYELAIMMLMSIEDLRTQLAYNFNGICKLYIFRCKLILSRPQKIYVCQPTLKAGLAI